MQLRQRVVDHCTCLGFEIDSSLNGGKLGDPVSSIGKKDAKHRTLVCHTDEQVSSLNEGIQLGEADHEQFEMARACAMRNDLW